ncbi:hypothetical protein KC957_02315, partial [Candidatus Saccharibacteria bacterium]|nr:hypothetical protein [Candidatus Saccharibacteria bacterium]
RGFESRRGHQRKRPSIVSGVFFDHSFGMELTKRVRVSRLRQQEFTPMPKPALGLPTSRRGHQAEA